MPPGGGKSRDPFTGLAAPLPPIRIKGRLPRGVYDTSFIGLYPGVPSVPWDRLNSELGRVGVPPDGDAALTDRLLGLAKETRRVLSAPAPGGSLAAVPAPT